MIIPPAVAFGMSLVDPAGFERIEYGYRSVGVHFWTPQAYRAGQLAKKLRAPLMVAVAAAVVALAVKVLRSVAPGHGSAPFAVMRTHKLDPICRTTHSAPASGATRSSPGARPASSRGRRPCAATAPRGGTPRRAVIRAPLPYVPCAPAFSIS